MLTKSFVTVFGGLLTAGAALMGLAEEPYVQASGNCYLDTEYYPNKDTCVEVDFEITDTSTTQPRVFGVEHTSSLSCVFYVNGNKKWAYSIKDGGVSGVAMTDADTARHTVILDSYNSKFYLITAGVTNQTQTITATRTKQGVYPLHLFGQNARTYDYGQAKEKIYRAKIYEKGELLHDFRPCVRNGIPGLRDQQTGLFIYAHENGALTAGGDVESITTDDGYLQSDGSHSIDTGYLPTQNTRLEADFEMLSTNNVGQPRICGSNGLRYTMYINGSKKFAYNAFDSETSGAASGTGYQTATSYAADTGVRHTFTVDHYRKRAALVTGATMNYSATIDTTMTLTEATGSLMIFAGKDWAQISKMKLYGFRIFESGLLVRDYIPYLKDGVPGLYDRINKGFLSYSAGILGGDYEGRGAYLESDGTQAILSDYFANPGSKIVADFEWLDVSTKQQRPFGADSDSASNPLSCSLYLNGSGYFAWAFCNGKGNFTALGSKPTASVRYVFTLDGPNDVVSVKGGSVDYSGTMGTTRTNTSAQPLGIFCDYDTDKGGFCRERAKIRLYSLKCYDNGVLTRQFLPYKSGDVYGLYDTVSKKAFTNLLTGANAFVMSGAGSDGSYTNLLVKPVNTRAKRYKPQILSAFAPGAVAYRWYRNGVQIPDATAAELAVAWNGTSDVDTYTVVPVFKIGGVFVDGESATCEFDNALKGVVLFFR